MKKTIEWFDEALPDVRQTDGQLAVVIPIVLALTIGSALFWGYQNSMRSGYSRAKTGSGLAIAGATIEANIRAALQTEHQNPNVNCANYTKINNEYRDFTKMPKSIVLLDEVRKPDKTIDWHSCLVHSDYLPTEVTATLDSYRVRLVISDKSGDLVAQMKSGERIVDLSIDLRTGSKAFSQKKRFLLRARRLCDYALVLTGTSGALIDSDETSKLNFAVDGKTVILSQLTAPTDVATNDTMKLFSLNQTPWAAFYGPVFADNINPGTSNEISRRNLSQIFMGGVHTGAWYSAEQVFGEHVQQILPGKVNDTAPPTIDANECDAADLTDKSIYSNPSGDFKLMFTTPTDNTVKPKHCGLIRAKNLTVECPQGLTCYIYGHLIAEKLTLVGGGLTRLTNPTATGRAGFRAKSDDADDSDIRTLAFTKLISKAKTADDAHGYYQAMLDCEPPKGEPGDLSAAFQNPAPPTPPLKCKPFFNIEVLQ